MSGVGGVGGPGRSRGAGRPEGPDGPGRKENVGKQDFAGRLDRGEGSTPAASSESSTAFGSLAGRIREGVDAHESREEILRGLVDDEARRQFGDEVSEEMTRSIATAFESDPALKRLFDRIYDAATQDQEGGR